MAVPGYTEIRELGHGGTGRVMLAVRDSDGLPVAIKHLSETLREDGEFAARFRAEARVIGEIDSPHTARLLDYVEAGGASAIVMELVDGVTLRRLIAGEGGTGVEAALTVLKGALLGLAEAHRRGVVHRDFKPENVIVTTNGDSKLVDFGVAARFGETGALAGTPAYMAPEQWDDAPAGPATDVYAATLVCYECLTGRRPFTAANLAALAFQHQHMPPPLEKVDGRLRGLIEHGLAKDPADRPASAEAFLAELEEVAHGTYGAGWELRGRSGLAVLAMPFAALLPSAGTGAGGILEGGVDSGAASGASTATGVVRSSLGAPAKSAVTGGLVLATAAAVASTFVIWSGSPSPSTDSGTALPPVSTGTASMTAPVSPEPVTPVTPVPSGSGTVSPPVIVTAGPSGQPTGPPATAGPASSAPASSAPATPPASATAGDRPPGPSGRPTGRRTETGSPPTRSAPPSTRPPVTRQPAGDPASTRPPATGGPATSAPAPRPAATSAPAPEPPPAKTHKPLLSVSVGLSLGGSLLGGGGGGLLDADLDVGLGSSLLGMLVVPGSALVGGRMAVRRIRKSRSQEKS
ncbi:protein kinase [Nonomuraea sp. NPDC047529]|uniref:protein kinase domain-containing protein n=1 Tax=Nonomuraea sp. NPDC047529 TaxID=3155623 RepID=UPI0033EE3C36